eukprot:5274749-Alexandrium_andersonii.AAC.1
MRPGSLRRDICKAIRIHWCKDHTLPTQRCEDRSRCQGRGMGYTRARKVCDKRRGGNAQTENTQSDESAAMLVWGSRVRVEQNNTPMHQ